VDRQIGGSDWWIARSVDRIGSVDRIKNDLIKKKRLVLDGLRRGVLLCGFTSRDVPSSSTSQSKHMKLKLTIQLLSGVLNSVATILFGSAEERLKGEKGEKETLVYVALKILANAKTIDQVEDALGFFSEAMDFVEEENVEVLSSISDLKDLVAELREDKNRMHKESGDEITQWMLQNRRTQEALAEARKELKETRAVNEKLNSLVSGFEIARED